MRATASIPAWTAASPSPRWSRTSRPVSAEAAGLAPADMLAPETREAIARWIAARSRAELEAMARERDVPLFTLAD